MSLLHVSPSQSVNLSSLRTPAQALPANQLFSEATHLHTCSVPSGSHKWATGLCVVPRPLKSGQESWVRDRVELAWVRWQSQARGGDQETDTGFQGHTPGLYRSILRLTPQLPPVWFNTKRKISPGGQKPRCGGTMFSQRLCLSQFPMAPLSLGLWPHHPNPHLRHDMTVSL